MEIHTENILKDRLRSTLRNPSDCSVLTHSDNRRIWGLRSCKSAAQIVRSDHNFTYPPAVENDLNT